MKNNSNLIWLDLEMTGLNPQYDHILEIAIALTDKDLNLIAEGPSLIIHQSDKIMESMNDWCKKMHGISGLTGQVIQSSISIEQAEQLVCEFLDPYIKKGEGIVCGNSIWQDKAFIAVHMAHLNSYFNYRIIDVSAIKELVKRWYPQNPYIDFKKSDNHRALTDVYESIEELKSYRKHFFISETLVSGNKN